MKKKIFIITSSRADYSLLFLTFKKLNQDKRYDTKLIAAASHNSKKFGNTFEFIKKDKIKIYKKIILKSRVNNPLEVCSSISFHITQLSKILKKDRPDLVILLGDRYETLSFAIACHYLKMKVAHIGGGDITEGSLDNQTRFAISNLSNIHFATNQFSKNILKKKLLINKNVYDVGSPGVELIKKTNFINKKSLEKKLKIKFKKNIFLITLHPATLDKYDTDYQVNNLIKALGIYKNIASLIFTFPNEDENNRNIIKTISLFEKKSKNVHIYKSLGRVKYFSILKIANLIIGNSSSGIYEAPYLNTPTINIGNRQKGRIMLNSIFNSKPDFNSIINNINLALKFKKNKTKIFYKYKNTSEIIYNKIKKYLIER